METLLDKKIEILIEKFTKQVSIALKQATLKELINFEFLAENLSSSELSKIVDLSTRSIKRKRIVKNYPKCAYPECESNRFVRGKGFCGKHWKMWLNKEIKDASYYLYPEKNKEETTDGQNEMGD